MRNLLIFLTLLVVSIRINAQEINKTHKDTLNHLITSYYKLNLKTFQADSKVTDIDKIFNLFTKDFTYVHPKYGGTYTRKDLYNGYIRNQKNGMYNGTIKNIKILNKIIGFNAIVVERTYVEKTKNGTKEGEPQMTLFEFKDDKIFRIFEYW